MIALPTRPRLSEADVRAWQEWHRTGYLPGDYVQDALRRGWSSTQTVAELVQVSLQRYGGSDG